MSMAPTVVFDRSLLSARRDRAAGHIASCAFLLDRVMDDVVDRLGIVRRSFEDVVCLGSHHGAPGRALRAALPDASVIETDVSQAMCRLCDGPAMCVDEEVLPFDAASVDCIVAPLTLQFVNDLPGSMVQIRRALRPDGFFLGAMTGGDTLFELAEAFAIAEADIRGGASPRVAPRVDVRALGGLLQRAGFTLPVTDVDQIRVTYATPLDLMRDLKAMGASNCLADRSRVPMSRELLMRAVEVYQDRFTGADGRVYATFEIITMTGWSPHPDQPQPLRPGSATHRLADALGVSEQSAGETVSGGPTSGTNNANEDDGD
ncbi:MAG: methyltransferase domain-containing protein [Pseudomonadota bacterium]